LALRERQKARCAREGAQRPSPTRGPIARHQPDFASCDIASARTFRALLNANVSVFIVSFRLLSRLRVSGRSRRGIREVRSLDANRDAYTSHARDARVRIKRACKNVLSCLFYTFVIATRAFVRAARRKQIAGLAAAFARVCARPFVCEDTCERYAAVTHEARTSKPCTYIFFKGSYPPLGLATPYRAGIRLRDQPARVTGPPGS
jgi:hypothetical protein